MVEPTVRILLIMENPGDARLIQVYLKGMTPAAQMEWRTRVAEGLAYLEDGQVELVLLDLTLPDSAGLATITRFRTSFPDVPIIILSGLEDPRLAVESLRMGAEDFLFKGALDQQLLRRSIQYVLGRVRGQAELRRTNALLAATLEATADAILVIDASGKIVGFNSQFSRMWDIPDEALRSDDEPRIRALLMAPLADPTGFLDATRPDRQKSEWSADTIRFRDGRVIERFARPHRVDDHVLGRVWSFRDVTGEQRTRQALEAEKEKFRSLMESAPDALVIVDEEGIVVLVNQQTERMFGYRRDEIIGRSVDTLVPSGLRGKHAGLRAAFFRNPRMSTIGDGPPLWAVRKDGSEFPVEITLSPIKTEQGTLVTAAVRDTSARRQIEEQIQRSNERLADAQAIAHLGSWEHDVDRDVVRWSDETYRIFGVPIGQPLDFAAIVGFIHPDDRLMFERIVKDAVESRRPFVVVHRIIRPDGGIRIMDVKGQVETGEEGHVVRLFGTGQDITEQKQAEEALEESYRLMAKNEKLAALGTLIAGVAHEINNPLAFVKSNEQVFDAMLLRLEKHPEPERGAIVDRMRRLLQTNKGGIERIEAIVRSLRQVARPSTGERQETDLVQLVRDTLPVLEPLRRDHNAEVEIIAPPARVPVLVNATEVSQVILNLVKNAYEVTPSGRKVRVRVVRDADGGSHVHVEDEGPGVPAEDIPQVFDPFFTTKPAGTGLGLSISAKIVESHGGELSCENIPGAGARFTLALPDPKVAPKAEPLSPPPRMKTDRVSVTPPQRGQDA